MNRWQLLLALVVAGALVLLATHDAAASDLYSNIGPGGSISGLADRYPLGNYALDQHFSAIKASLTGGVDASGIPAMIAYFLANLLWQITAFVANALITLFAFAFSLDLVNGSQATGGTGALGPVGQAISNLYAYTFGQAWMVVGVTLAGCWAMWRALVQRRYTETATTLGMSLVYCLLALAVVSQPQATIGSATRWSNELSTAFLSVTSHGEVASGPAARRAAADQLFSTLVAGPWTALEFGGTEHCTRPGTGSKDHDPVSVPVRPLDAAASRRLASSAGTVDGGGKQCVNNRARYASHFLRFAPGSDERDGEYVAINTADPGKLPDADKNTGYEPALIDKPAADAMEKGGQYQRLLLAIVILLGELGAFCLLGALSLSVVLAQLVVLLLACFSPVALVAAVIPGRGHELFKTWASHLGTYLVRKAAYSLILAVLLAVLNALQTATGNLGWLMSFGLQGALLWMVFLQRHKLAARLVATVSGQAPEREAQLRRLLGVAYATRAVTPARRRHRTTPPTGSTPQQVEPEAPARSPIDEPPMPRVDEHAGPARPRQLMPRRRDEVHHTPPGDRAPGPATAAAAAPVAGEAREAHRHARADRGDTQADAPVVPRWRAASTADDRRPGPQGGERAVPPARRPAATTSASAAEDQAGRNPRPPAPPRDSDSERVDAAVGEPADQTPRCEPASPPSLADELRTDRQRLALPETEPDPARPVPRRDLPAAGEPRVLPARRSRPDTPDGSEGQR